MEILEAINNNFDNPDLTDRIAPGKYRVRFTTKSGVHDATFNAGSEETFANLCTRWQRYCDVLKIPNDCVTQVSYVKIGGNGMTKERMKELLDRIVEHESAGRSCKETIRHFLWLGFTSEELHDEFGFSQLDIADAKESMDEYEEVA